MEHTRMKLGYSSVALRNNRVLGGIRGGAWAVFH